MDMIDRVACAIALHVYGGYHIDRAEREKWPTWERCITAAKASMQAMREPTGEMSKAGGEEHSGNDYFSPGDSDMEATEIYMAMVDAALHPRTETAQQRPTSTETNVNEQRT